MKTLQLGWLVGPLVLAVVLLSVWGQCPSTGKSSGSKAVCGTEKAECTPCPAGKTADTCTAKKAVATEALATVDTTALAVLVKSKVALVFDARSGQWDDGHRIPGAGSLNDQSTAEQVAAAIPSKDKLVVTYCGSTKCGASAKLAHHLKALGYSNILEYPAGIAGWRAAGNNTEKAN